MRIALANADFHCRVLGNGAKLVIAFHGFGQDGACFQPILKNNPDITIYAPDLPFHGATNVHDSGDFVLTSEHVIELVDYILQATGKATFSIVAFSIGVRLSFPIIEKYGTQLERLVLLAPDGITENIWYRLATSTALSRFLFRKLLEHLHILKRAGTTLSKGGLLDKRNLLFAMKSIDTREKRDQVYLTWTALRHLKLNISRNSRTLNENGVVVSLFLGEKDAVIKRTAVEPMLKSVTRAGLVMLPCGHTNLIDCVARQGAEIF